MTTGASLDRAQPSEGRARWAPRHRRPVSAREPQGLAPVIAYLGQRLLSLIFTLFLATIAIFRHDAFRPRWPVHVHPGGPDASGDAQHQVKYGLADPIWQQYLKWIWQLLHGYLGIPFEEPTMTVNHLIASAWPITLIVGGLTIAVSYTLGPAARLHRRHQAQHLGRFPDHRRGLDDRRRAAQLRHRVPLDRGFRHKARLATRRRLGIVEGRDLARHRVLALPHGPDGALHAGEHARGHLRRLRPHGPGARACPSGASSTSTSCAPRSSP